MKGDVSRAELQYIVRDHDAASFEVRQKTLAHITEILNEKWGEGTVDPYHHPAVPQYERDH